MKRYSWIFWPLWGKTRRRCSHPSTLREIKHLFLSTDSDIRLLAKICPHHQPNRSPRHLGLWWTNNTLANLSSKLREFEPSTPIENWIIFQELPLIVVAPRHLQHQGTNRTLVNHLWSRRNSNHPRLMKVRIWYKNSLAWWLCLIVGFAFKPSANTLMKSYCLVFLVIRSEPESVNCIKVVFGI